MKNKTKALIFLGTLLLILAVLMVVLIYKLSSSDRLIMSYDERKATELTKTTIIDIVPTMSCNITADSAWCGTFQLVWNDMKNELVKQDVIFTPQEKMVINLNKEEFTEDMISEEYYYKKYGLKTLALKEEIEKGINAKFDEESDILDEFEWTEEANENNYFFYAMLYKKFEFLKEFEKLGTGIFGDKYNDIKYFGIDSNTSNDVGKQIKVLYYNSEEDFAIVINTKTDDEIIFCKCPQGTNFKEIYEDMNKQAKKYDGSKIFKKVDEFKAPNLEFNEKIEYTELENKPFKTLDGTTLYIGKSIQTIKFTIDEKGGKIKSEAAIEVVDAAAAGGSTYVVEPRFFYVDDTFAIFLREKGKEVPYFAARIEDITKFQ